MRIPTFSHAQLTEKLSYDQATGIFLWKKTRSSSRIGTRAGTVDFYGRRLVSIQKRQYFEHRLAWFYVHGVFPTKDIDHINGDHSDNRIENLRLATHAENMQNHRSARSDSTAGLAGVSRRKRQKNPWYAQIRLNGKKMYLGAFATKEDAHEAYLQAKRVVHPFCTV